MGLFTTLGLSIAGGLICGFFLRRMHTVEDYGEDLENWNVEEEHVAIVGDIEMAEK